MIWEETQENLPGFVKAGSLNYSEFFKVSISSDKNANKIFLNILKYKFITQFHSPSFRCPYTHFLHKYDDVTVLSLTIIFGE